MRSRDEHSGYKKKSRNTVVGKAKVAIIIGPPGAGKTVCGRIVSCRLKWRFADTDELIEAQCGLSIRDIFSRYGEQYFRQLESDTLTKLSTRYSLSASRQEESLVLSTGAGLPVTAGNFEIMEKLGTIICLTANATCLAERLRHSSERPLLSVLSQPACLAYPACQDHDDRGDNPMYLTRRLADLLNSRQPFYARAAYTIDTASLSPEAVADKIQRILLGVMHKKV